MKKIFFFYIACITTSIIFAMEQPTSHVWDGKKYSQNSNPQFQRAMQLLDKEDLSGASNILDIGCGPGRITIELSKRASKAWVVGTDASESMIQEATKRYGDVPNLTFTQQNATTLTFPDDQKKFDYITSFACLHWIKDHQAVIKNVAQYIAPQGIFLASGSGSDDNNPLMRAFNNLKTSGPDTVKALLQNFDPKEHYFPLHKDVIHKLLTDANFQSIDIQESKSSTVFKNNAELAGWLLGFLGGLGGLKQLPAPQKKAFFDLLTARYVKQVQLTEKGEIPYGFPRIIIKASLAKPTKE